MEYLQVGKYTNTHGLKGEIKIMLELSNKGSIFDIGNTIYIGKNKVPFKIMSYRRHQKYDMITLETLDSIEAVLPYKGEYIYINSENMKKTIVENLIDYEVYNNGTLIGLVVEILKGTKYDFIVVSDDRIIIPYINNFIVSIDKDNKIIKTNYMI
ncbi:MAG: ribosome maturation factor RimM [Bacilli bacterium]|nr:ribosome maturation factor RimM [Bacilli bacterium]MDD3305065.1 ribosome maturation factor RimM [Bacilli bacterium]MDD4053486.1 ribosome maturation factor RimM [Bacilli bacterium]MDD4411521.1 ribosome maturation factor RimM [Bacilli bacterium]